MLLCPAKVMQLVSSAATSSSCVQVLYMRALMRLAFHDSAIMIRGDLLATAVRHLVALDCEIRWQDIAFAGASAYSTAEAALSSRQPETCGCPAEGVEELKDEENTDDPFEEAEHLGVAAEAADLARDSVARGGFEGAVDCQGPASTSGRTQVGLCTAVAGRWTAIPAALCFGACACRCTCKCVTSSHTCSESSG